MSTATQNSVELSAALMEKARRYAAQENRSVDALVDEALRLYMETEPELNAFFRRNRQAAAAQGFTPDEYAQKIVDEIRAEHRKSA